MSRNRRARSSARNPNLLAPEHAREACLLSAAAVTAMANFFYPTLSDRGHYDKAIATEAFE
jgi:hypothetical protein